MSGVNSTGYLILCGVFLAMAIDVLVAIVFLVLRFTGVITWSWFWVTSPVWILVSVLVVATFAVSFICNRR